MSKAVTSVVADRSTNETQLRVATHLGEGTSQVDTTMPLLDHGMVAWAGDSGVDLTLPARRQTARERARRTAERVFVPLTLEGATRVASQWVGASTGARREGAGWRVPVAGARTPAERDAVEWTAACARLGAGEIRRATVDSDGAPKNARRAIHIPVREGAA